MKCVPALILPILMIAGPAGASTIRYFHTDALGSPVAITDSDRNVLERREYEPYGTQLTPAPSNGPGYTGHVQDAETGLIYMQQRFYDPSLGRFLSIDPVTADAGSGDNFNRYWYANNNPYRFTDPDGRFGHEDAPGQHTGAAYIGFSILGMDVNSPKFKPMQQQKHSSARAGSTFKGGRLTNQQRYDRAVKDVNKIKAEMEGTVHKTKLDAVNSFRAYVHPISVKWMIEVDSLIVPAMYGYRLESTIVSNNFDRPYGYGYTVAQPSDGNSTVHTHPINTTPNSAYPFSDPDNSWNWSTKVEHYVTTPDGVFKWERGKVTNVSP